jgi:hypothetical protein
MARVMRRVASIVTLVLAVAALGACGGGTSTQEKSAYARQVNAAQSKFALTVSTAASESKGTQGLNRLRLTLQRFRAAIDDVVRDLRRIDAPSEVSKEHAQLISIMSGYGDEVRRAGDAMSNPTPQEAQLARQRLDSAQRSVTAQVNAEIAAINVKLSGK